MFCKMKRKLRIAVLTLGAVAFVIVSALLGRWPEQGYYRSWAHTYLDSESTGYLHLHGGVVEMVNIRPGGGDRLLLGPYTRDGNRVCIATNIFSADQFTGIVCPWGIHWTGPHQFNFFTRRAVRTSKLQKITLHAKGVAFETVEIDLIRRPAWFLEKASRGVVPLLECDEGAFYTSAAVNEGNPPTFSVIPMATGAVTDLGANEIRVSRDAPSQRAMSTALEAETRAPVPMAARIGSHSRRISPRLRYSGTASATVAGPSRKCTNCAPSK